MDKYLEPTFYMDSDSQMVMDFTESAIKGVGGDVEKAVALFYAVRDGIRYNPYSMFIDKKEFKASSVLKRQEGFCVPKSILLAAVSRAAGIPARLGFANVKNHLTTRRLRETMQTDIFVFHGYTEFFINGKWVKATCAFNQSLCEKFNTKPLEFDGLNDSLLHPYDMEGKKHMEYIDDHGAFDDFPYDQMLEEFIKYYPHWFSAFKDGTVTINGDFEEERVQDVQAIK